MDKYALTGECKWVNTKSIWGITELSYSHHLSALNDLLSKKRNRLQTWLWFIWVFVVLLTACLTVLTYHNQLTFINMITGLVQKDPIQELALIFKTLGPLQNGTSLPILNTNTRFSHNVQVLAETFALSAVFLLFFEKQFQ